MYQTLKTTAAALLITLLSGCAHRCIYANYPGALGGQKLGPSGMGRTIELSHVGSSKTKSNLIVGRASLQNLTNDPQSLAYQFSWVSSDGMPIAQNRGLIPITLSPEENMIISGVSPSSQSAQFKLKVCQHSS